MNDRHGKVRIWGAIPSILETGKTILEDTPTHEVSGPYTEIVETLKKLSPGLPYMEIVNGLARSAWQTDIVWLGGHRMGLEVLLISGAQPQEPKIAPQALDEKAYFLPKRAANGRFITSRKG